MSKFNIEFKESIKTGGNRLGNLIENPFKNLYMSELRSELKQFGFTYSFINKLAGY